MLREYLSMKAYLTRLWPIVILLVIATLQTYSSPVASARASSATLYVDANHPSAQDSSDHGSLNQPWKTLDYAFRRLGPGDTLLIRGGTYTNSFMSLTAKDSGRREAPITVQAFQGEEVIVRNGSGIRFEGANWWVIDGLIFEQYADRLFGLGAHTQLGSSQTIPVHHITIRNCEFRYSNQATFDIRYASYVVLENNYFHHIRSGVSGKDLSTINIPYLADQIAIVNNRFEDIGSDGIHLATNGTSPGANVASVTIIGNEFWVNRPYTGPFGNVGENGIDVKWVQGPIVIADNVIHGFRPTTPEQDASGDNGKGLVIHNSARNVTVEGNLFYDNTSHLAISQNRGGTPVSNVIVHNNIFRDARPANEHDSLIGGYAIGVTQADTVQVYHNTFYDNEYYLQSKRVVNGVFRNNFIYKGRHAVNASTSQWEADHNVWYAPTGRIPDVLKGNHDLWLPKTFETSWQLMNQLVASLQSAASIDDESQWDSDEPK